MLLSTVQLNLSSVFDRKTVTGISAVDVPVSWVPVMVIVVVSSQDPTNMF